MTSINQLATEVNRLSAAVQRLTKAQPKPKGRVTLVWPGKSKAGAIAARTLAAHERSRAGTETQTKPTTGRGLITRLQLGRNA